MITTAIIVAGGLGTRLRPLTEKTPKPLLPIKGKPILEHTINHLKKHGVKRVVLSVGYKANKIKRYFKDGHKFGIKISYSLETEPIGTGGATKKAAAKLKNPFFLLWGDNLTDVNFGQLYVEYTKNKNKITMALTRREDVENFGVAKLHGKKVTTFIEKPKREKAPSNLINAGVFVLDPLFLKLLPKGKSSFEKDCLEHIAPLGNLFAYIHEGQWFPTDTLEKYGLANKQFIPGNC